MSKEYFYEDEFVHLSWDDVLDKYSNTKYVTIDRYVRFWESEPVIDVFSGDYHSFKESGKVLFILPYRVPQSLIFCKPEEITQEIWDAVELLFGPEYTRIAQDSSGSIYVYDEKPNRGIKVWSNAPNGNDHVLPGLENYFDNWETSLREKPTQK